VIRKDYVFRYFAGVDSHSILAGGVQHEETGGTAKWDMTTPQSVRKKMLSETFNMQI
jgi:hypothetical protein